MISSHPNSCSACPIAETSRGFALGVGDPLTAKLAIILETSSSEEIGWFLNAPAPDVLPSPREELLRRQAAYPRIESRFLIKGVPVVGRQGTVLNSWLLPKAGIRRSEVFIDLTLRCWPAQGKKGFYPTGKARFEAERVCRQYDRVQLFKPDAIVLTMPPGALMKEITALPLLIKDLEKAASFVQQGYRTLVLMGGYAADVFMGFGSNTTRWRGHYELTSKWDGSEGWYARVLARAASRVGSAKRVKKVKVGVMGDGLDLTQVKVKKPRRAAGCQAPITESTSGICGFTKAVHPTVLCAKFISGRKKKVAA